MVGKNKLATTSASRLSVAAVPLVLLIRLSPFLLCTFLLSACNQNTVEPKVASTNSSSQSSDSASGTTTTSSATTSTATTSASSNSSTSSSSGSAQPEDIIELSPEAIKNAGIKSEPIKDMSYESDIKTTGELKADENNVFHIFWNMNHK
jgi:cytoskeletal protein RodZ